MPLRTKMGPVHSARSGRPVKTDGDKIRIGPYELRQTAAGELVLRQAARAGALTYSPSRIRHGPFRLFMPLRAKHDHFVNATDFSRIRTRTADRGLTLAYQQPVVAGAAYDIQVVLRVKLGAGGDSLEFSASVKNACPHRIKEVWLTAVEGLVRLNGIDRIHLRNTTCSFDDVLRSPINLGWE